MNYNDDNLIETLVDQRARAIAQVPNDSAIEHRELKSENKQLKVSLFATLVTLFVVTLGAWFTFGNYEESFHTNTQKMDSIYNEIGDVRGENTNVYMELKKTQTELTALNASLESLSDRMSALDPDAAAQIKVDIKTLSQKFQNNSLIKASVDKKGQVALTYPEEMVNVLLVGSNGGLTDTIMVASVNPETEKITLISVPRDLYVNGRRINEIYYHHGADKLKQALNDILGLKVDEYVAVDLKAFPKVIDALGGIDVYVEKDITDYQYPTKNKGYQTFSIQAGQKHMNGELAEMYARSRKSTSDFDRARRQQKVISALFRKTKELKLADNKTEAVKMYDLLSTYVHTDVDVLSALVYARMFKDYEIETNNVLSSSNYLYSMINAAGAYVLLPSAGNYDQIKSYVFELVVE